VLINKIQAKSHDRLVIRHAYSKNYHVKFVTTFLPLVNYF
jgi:hypothetical protein